MSKLRLIFLIILIPTAFFRCSTESPIPEVYVNFILILDHHQVLNVPGNSIFIPTEGYRGLIVTHGFDEQDKYYAYDAACTYDPEIQGATIEIDGISAVCPICGSKFSLMLNGYVENGPASLSLKTYVVNYNQNTHELVIHN
ncbi:MAG: hypothetical protein P1P88_26240 [Bacteroidales bacterium]|nr:hypothetical protein [Bacteroidales bacterium]